MNKCFLLNPEKISVDSSCRFRENAKNAPFIPKKGVTEQKVTLL